MPSRRHFEGLSRNKSALKRVILSAMRKFLCIAVFAALAPQGPIAWSVAYACQMTGQVSTSCCCKSGAVDPFPTIEAASRCCEVTVPGAHASNSVVCALPNGSELRLSFHPFANALSWATLSQRRNSFVDITGVANGPPLPVYLVNESFRR